MGYDNEVIKLIDAMTIKIELKNGTSKEVRVGLDGYNPGIHQVLSFYLGHTVSNHLDECVVEHRMRVSPLLSKIPEKTLFEWMLPDTKDKFSVYKDFEKRKMSVYPRDYKKGGCTEVCWANVEEMRTDMRILEDMLWKARKRF